MWRKISLFLLVLFTTLLWLDVFTYQGYLSSLIHMPSKVIMLAVLFLGIVSTYFSTPKQSENCKILFFGASLTIFYCLIIAVEGGASQGFVFSHLHLRPESMFVAVLGTFWAISATVSKKIWLYLTFVAISFYVARLAPIVVTQVYVTTREVVRSPFASRADKMRLNWGGFYDFTRFVNAHTPDSAIIAIPPRSNTHPLIGNNSFFWYFVYPRTLLSLPLHVIDPAGAEYIVIDGSNDIWPDITLPADHIWYYQEGGSVTELADTLFDPRDSRYIGAIGLIKLKEEGK